jgi:hypothetical protein
MRCSYRGPHVPDGTLENTHMGDAHDAPRPSSSEAWARFRFSVVGPLLSSPPAAGELREALVNLAARQWLHPMSGEPKRFSVVTIERWYYAAKGAPQDPMTQLARSPRKDAGRSTAVRPEVADFLRQQHTANSWWSLLTALREPGGLPTREARTRSTAVLLDSATFHEASWTSSRQAPPPCRGWPRP